MRENSRGTVNLNCNWKQWKEHHCRAEYALKQHTGFSNHLGRGSTVRVSFSGGEGGGGGGGQNVFSFRGVCPTKMSSNLLLPPLGIFLNETLCNTIKMIQGDTTRACAHNKSSGNMA